MRLPICVFDLESDMLCPSCQDRFDSGELSEFDIEFSKWLLANGKDSVHADRIDLLRALRFKDLLVLVVKKKSVTALTDDDELMAKIREIYGEILIVEGPAKLRTIVRELIAPAIEVGVNTLYLPNGFKESIVMLRPQDRERIKYSKEQLKAIASAVANESILFQYQDERVAREDQTEGDDFGDKLREFSGSRR
ncbi:MAG: hypothetical protein ACFFD3_04310 [Candidatus Thorarchaeota archaeon]